MDEDRTRERDDLPVGDEAPGQRDDASGGYRREALLRLPGSDGGGSARREWRRTLMLALLFGVPLVAVGVAIITTDGFHAVAEASLASVTDADQTPGPGAPAPVVVPRGSPDPAILSVAGRGGGTGPCFGTPVGGLAPLGNQGGGTGNAGLGLGGGGGTGPCFAAPGGGQPPLGGQGGTAAMGTLGPGPIGPEGQGVAGPGSWGSPQAAAPADPRGGLAVANVQAPPSYPTKGVLSPSLIPPAGGGRPPFQEAHWQGIELIPLTKGIARLLRVPSKIKGVVADDVTFPADRLGFQAGDVVVAVDGADTPTLEAFIEATDRVRDNGRANLQVVRKGGSKANIELVALDTRLGVANGETAPMIKAGSLPPHAYRGPCTGCHRIGTVGQLPADQGDLLTASAPPIKAGRTPPHRDRGVCTSCHQVTP